MRLIVTIAGLALGLFAAAATAQSGPLLLIANKGEDSVSFVDLTTGRELARRETGPNPHEIAVSPDGRQFAVVSYGGAAIDLFDVARRERIKTIDLGANMAPHGLLWLRDGRILATTEKSRTLTVVSADREVSSISTDQAGGHMVAVSGDLSHAYVANIEGGTITAIDLGKGRKLRDATIGKRPEGIAISADGRHLWVTEVGGDAVHVLDAAELRPIAKLASGKSPIRIVISPDGRTAVTSNFGDGTLNLYDTATLKPLRTIKVSGQGGAFQQVTILFSPDGKRLYVAETGIDRVAEVDMATGKVLGRLPAGKNGDGLAIIP